MASPVNLVPGSIFARDFRVVRPLAEGGMGAVYVVEQISTGNQRALKVMHPQVVEDAKSRERFTQEARVGAQIHSAHVVEVAAAGVDEETGTPWLAMELLEGEDLSAMVKRRGAIGSAEVREVFEQLGDALGHAHAAGVVHRDLKPENIFISVSRLRGVPFVTKVLDFGIAKITSEHKTAAVTSVIGSPLWMAPEQAHPGAKIKPSTDVWAMGLIAFYMLTGRRYWQSANGPEAGLSLSALLVEIVVNPIEPPSARAAALGFSGTLPDGFDAWFARCVTRDPEQRFQDANEAVAALVPLLPGDSPHRLSSPPIAAAPLISPTPSVAMGSASVVDALSATMVAPTGHVAPPSFASSTLPASANVPYALSATVAAPTGPVAPQVIASPQPPRRSWAGLGIAALVLAVAITSAVFALRSHAPEGPVREVPTPPPRPASPTPPIARPVPAIVAEHADAAVHADAAAHAVTASAQQPDAGTQGEGRLEVHCHPRCQVTVDGVAQERPSHAFRIAAGEHTVVASRDGASQLRVVRVEDRRKAVVEFEFEGTDSDEAPVATPAETPVATHTETPVGTLVAAHVAPTVVVPVTEPVAAPPPPTHALPSRPAHGDIDTAMHAITPEARTCHGTGRVFVNVQFASDGHATGSTVEGPYSGTAIGNCITHAALQAHVPPFQQSSVSVVFPITL